MALRRGAAAIKKASQRAPFEAGLLPDDEKEVLCRALLAEFGVTRIQTGGSGELIHSCCLPTGRHANGDVNASASLNYLKLTYNCLGCGQGGGLLWFIATCRGDDDEVAASHWLAHETGINTVQDLSKLMDYFERIYADRSISMPPIPKLDPSVLDPWLMIHPYMTEIRHIPAETLMRFRVGYDQGADRIVIPHFWRGDLVGWQTRRLGKVEGEPRWKSSPDFPKYTTIFNHDPSRAAIVVESPMSTLRHVHRVPIVEATFGAEVTERQVRHLGKHPKVVLFFDNDPAGWHCTEVVGEALERYTSVWAVENPFGPPESGRKAPDPADFDEEMFGNLVADAVPFSVWERPRSLMPWRPKAEAA